MLCDELPDLQIMERNRRYSDEHLPYLAAEIDAEAVESGHFVNIEIKTVHPSKAPQWGCANPIPNTSTRKCRHAARHGWWTAPISGLIGWMAPLTRRRRPVTPARC